MKRKTLTLAFLLAIGLSVSSCNLPFGVGGHEAPDPTTPQTESSRPSVQADAPSPEPITSTVTQESMAEDAVTATVSATASLPVYRSPQIISIRMFSPTRGWAVADDRNRLLVTVDGGETWLDATPPDLMAPSEGFTTLGLSPFFLDADTAWFSPVTAEEGMLYHTMDGGLTWDSVSVPFGWASYYFLNPQEGWALEDLGAGAGSHYVALHRTPDGGQTWTPVFSHEPGTMKSLPGAGTKNGITFVDSQRGFIGGSIPMTDHFHFYQTEDGGASWSQVAGLSLPGEFSGSFLDVWQPVFVDSQAGFLPVRAVGAGDVFPLLIYRSTDAGRTWAYQGAIPGGQDVVFINPEVGWAVSEGSLFQTINGGTRWETVPTLGLPSDEALIQVDFVDQDHGWLLAFHENGSETLRNLYRTLDGGGTWELLQP